MFLRNMGRLNFMVGGGRVLGEVGFVGGEGWSGVVWKGVWEVLEGG